MVQTCGYHVSPGAVQTPPSWWSNSVPIRHRDLVRRTKKCLGRFSAIGAMFRPRHGQVRRMWLIPDAFDILMMDGLKRDLTTGRQCKWLYGDHLEHVYFQFEKPSFSHKRAWLVLLVQFGVLKQKMVYFADLLFKVLHMIQEIVCCYFLPWFERRQWPEHMPNTNPAYRNQRNNTKETGLCQKKAPTKHGLSMCFTIFSACP